MASSSIVEVKSFAADFRSDRKMGEYRDFCDLLSFRRVARIFRKAGLRMRPHRGGPVRAMMLREGAHQPLPPARRRALTLRFARMAAGRLMRLSDPAALEPEV